MGYIVKPLSILVFEAAELLLRKSLIELMEKSSQRRAKGRRLMVLLSKDEANSKKKGE